jgi:hypothetical protein
MTIKNPSITCAKDSFNDLRSHSSLGMQTPNEIARKSNLQYKVISIGGPGKSHSKNSIKAPTVNALLS